jgi:sugar O-acyltransferase (sialic acid O-acetyltransferase NeuD family)
MAKVVLFGNGRGADVAYRFLSKDTNHEIVGFAVDEKYIRSRELRGLPLVPFEEVEKHYPPEDFRMFILLGYQSMNGLRQKKFEAAKAKGYTLESYVASDIFRVEPVCAGENCFILDNQSISLDVKIGNNVVAWSSNHIGDMSTIADHVWLASHVTIAASVTIEENVFLGVGATVATNVRLGAGSFVGAHALISNDVAPRSVHVASGQPIDVDANAFMRIMTMSKKL